MADKPGTTSQVREDVLVLGCAWIAFVVVVAGVAGLFLYWAMSSAPVPVHTATTAPITTSPAATPSDGEPAHQPSMQTGEAPAALPPLPPQPAALFPAPANSYDWPEVTLASDRVEIALGGPIKQLAWGMGGRMLAVLLSKSQQVVVIDISRGQVVYQLPVDGDDTLIAAGLEKLLIASPSKRTLQRYDLATGRREQMAFLAHAGVLRQIMLGCLSRGPVIGWYDGPVELYDTHTLEPMAVNPKLIGDSPAYDYRMVLSANGRVATGWNNGLSSPPYDVMSLRDDGVRRFSTPFGDGMNGRFLWPNCDGTQFFRFDATIYDQDMQPIGVQGMGGGNLLPTFDRRFYVRLARNGNDRYSDISICAACDRRILATCVKTEDVCGHSAIHLFGILRGRLRVMYADQPQVLAYVPITDDRVVIRRFGVEREMRRLGVDYFYVQSLAPVYAAAGRTYRYEIEAKSSAGGLAYQLMQGPAGMTVSDQGVVQWAVPADWSGASTPVIVSVTDASKLERLHTFAIEAAPVTEH